MVQSHLPADIIIQYILCRLSLKTLGKCRLVCKSWLHLISDPFFINFYEAHGPALLGLPADTFHCRGSSYLFEFKGGGRSNHTIKNRELESARFRILTSCNGLVACVIRGRSCIYLWNPFLNHYFALPITEDNILKSSPNFDQIGFDFEDVYGFGHSRNSNHYKVLRIIKPRARAYKGTILAEICTVGSTWRAVKDVAKWLHCENHCTFFNGSLHWIVRDDSSSQLICAFEIESECFGFVGPPVAFYSRKRFCWTNMVAFRGCLCICASDELAFRPDYEIWVMKEYGVKDSWIKEFSIKRPTVEWWNPNSRFHLLKYSDDDDGEILILSSDYNLFDYNLKNRTYKRKRKVETSYSHIIVVPSFVSLKNLVINNLASDNYETNISFV